MPLLRDPNSKVRVAAAGALCARGNREAARTLLADAERWDGVRLLPLNALRRPKEWAALSTIKSGRPSSDRKPKLLRALAEAGGLKADFVLRDTGSGSVWHATGEPVIEIVDHLLRWGDHELLLEEGRLCLIPQEESLSYWKAWAAGEGIK
jgi:hypothetical protein